MAIKQALTLSLFSLLALILTTNGADVAAPAPSVDCTSSFTNMAACLTFVENGSTIAKPEKGCCPGLKLVVKENVECLCEVFKQSQDFGVTLDFNKTLSLPSVCKVKTPPFSECNITLSGVSPPATSPSASSPLSGGTSSASSPSSGEAPSTPTGEASISTGSAPAPSKSMAAQIGVHPFFTTIAILASSMLIYRYSV